MKGYNIIICVLFLTFADIIDHINLISATLDCSKNQPTNLNESQKKWFSEWNLFNLNFYQIIIYL